MDAKTVIVAVIVVALGVAGGIYLSSYIGKMTSGTSGGTGY